MSGRAADGQPPSSARMTRLTPPIAPSVSAWSCLSPTPPSRSTPTPSPTREASRGWEQCAAWYASGEGGGTDPSPGEEIPRDYGAAGGTSVPCGPEEMRGRAVVTLGEGPWAVAARDERDYDPDDGQLLFWEGEQDSPTPGSSPWPSLRSPTLASPASPRLRSALPLAMPPCPPPELRPAARPRLHSPVAQPDSQPLSYLCIPRAHSPSHAQPRHAQPTHPSTPHSSNSDYEAADAIWYRVHANPRFQTTDPGLQPPTSRPNLQPPPLHPLTRFPTLTPNPFPHPSRYMSMQDIKMELELEAAEEEDQARQRRLV